ncbi:hypothetical protein [Mycobacterium sp. AZCC_0083]|uniref:hypothetical protein n=1 Tax=Mycobacterium sp. AZCC_0083 TaxID=2735882 RepID=UPI0016225CF6|nr:hypothetical protein [Mycobacterium sp. AZCC_0083]MBB5168499.1 hypothetical protein [Mycobacterium sp. AZCC_0083]
MAARTNPIWVPSATLSAFARGTNNTQSATRYLAHLFSGRPADGTATINVQQSTESQQQTRHYTPAQLRAEAQALNPQAKSPSKIAATITSPRGTS